jgi:hypothetical protein
MSRVGFVKKHSLSCSDATASSFVAKVCDEVLGHCHAVGVKRHTRMRH